MIRPVVIALLALAALLAACGAPSTPTTSVAAPTAPPPATPLPPVKETVVVVVTPTPQPTAAPKLGGTLIAARAADAKGLDPHKQTAFSSFRMLELIYDPLLALDKDLKVVPNLAESWTWSADSKALTMNLRKNVKFHNGDPMTSEDVKFSFERILDEKTAAAGRSFFTDIDTIETPDANTVVFKLKRPNGAITAAMTNPNSAILSKRLVNSGADPARIAIGTGAFKLVNWEPDKIFKVVANRDFWIPGLPRLDGIEFRTIPDESSILAGLRARTIDWALINDPRAAIRAGAGAGSGLTVMRSPALAYHVLQLNAGRPVFADARVRQAVSCAIDRQEVLDTASLGEGEVTGPATPPFYRVSLNDLSCYKKDVEKAKKLLADAGNPVVKFKVIAASDEPPTAVAEAQNIQAQLKKIGVEVEIETLELGVYVKRWLDADFDAAVALNGGNPDPDIMFFRYWHSTGNLNKVAAYKNAAIDKLLEDGRTTADPVKRKEIYASVQKSLTEAAPWVWLYVGYEYRIMQPSVKGFTALSNGSLIYLREAWLDK
ncbi:MAG: ABC transporter substrate-binding protein [Chloroflexi bacterium]|nr:ABC transporter substrate-binding protein [Chloroflexota bacterium]